jgi:hypothetical protein
MKKTSFVSGLLWMPHRGSARRQHQRDSDDPNGRAGASYSVNRPGKPAPGCKTRQDLRRHFECATGHYRKAGAGKAAHGHGFSGQSFPASRLQFVLTGEYWFGYFPVHRTNRISPAGVTSATVIFCSVEAFEGRLASPSGQPVPDNDIAMIPRLVTAFQHMAGRM